MTIKIFDDGDGSYLNWMAQNPDGYVLNRYRRGSSKNYLVIHMSGCQKISTYNDMSQPQGFTTRGYIKVCSTHLPSLRRYAQSCGRSDGTFSGRCRICNPNVGSPNQELLISPVDLPDSTKSPANKAPAKPAKPSKPINTSTSSSPFTEGRVEILLQPWLEERGFNVKKRVRVKNGIIDVVASTDSSTWIIEAKGEDKGGYNSAEMNFRIGISQICSRMEPGARETLYGLAIPMTDNFFKVLKKHNNFSVFAQMGIWLFIADGNGTITALEPVEVQQHIDQMAEPLST